MLVFLLLFMLKYVFVLSKSVTDPPMLFKDLIKHKDARSLSDFVFWPNGTIPFYINESHFDAEQASAILRVLHDFKTVTCLKFVPVIAPPAPNHVVMVFQNPQGEKLCNIRDMGRPRDQPQTVDLGYKCLESPRLDMIIMRALGFPFEHNRMMRDIFIEVQKENVLQEYLGLFDKESALPADLSNLPYDTQSVLHFDEFEYTKNGHRTIIIRDKAFVPHEKRALSRLDKRKIQIVYGPECRKRERAEKLEVCKVYAPSASRRRKRSISVANLPNNTKEDVTIGIVKKTTTTIIPKKTQKENSRAANTNGNEKETQIPRETQKKNSKASNTNGNEKETLIPRETQTKNSKAANTNGKEKEKTKSPKETQKENSKAANTNGNEIETIIPRETQKENSKAVNTTLESAIPQVVPRASAANESSEEFNIKLKPIEAKVIVDNVEDLLEQALIEAKQKHCNGSEVYKKPNVPKTTADFSNNSKLAMDVLDFIGANIQALIKEQLSNLTEFCGYGDLKPVLRYHCLKTNDPRCRQYWFKSTTISSGRYMTRITGNFVFSTGHPQKKNRYLNMRKKRGINSETNTEYPDKHQVTWTHVVTVDNDTQDIKKNGKKWEYNVNRRDINEETYVKPFRVSSREEERKINRFKVKKSVRKPDINDNQDEVPFEKEHSRFKTLKSKHNAPKKQDHSEFSEDEKQKRDADVQDLDSKERIEMKKKNQKRQKIDVKEREEIVTPRRPHKRQKNKEATDEKLKRIDQSIEKKNQKIVGSNEKFVQSVEKVNLNIDGSNEKPKRQKHAKKIVEPEPVPEKIVIPDINDLPDVIKLPKENFDFYNERKWTSGILPYYIEENSKYDADTLRMNIKEVSDILKEKTCVQLKEIGEGDFKKYQDYLILDSKHRDYVTGKVGGRQVFGSVELFEGGQHRQFTAMMVMAMLGFYFEVARTDRDKYIRVHIRHVRPDKLHHFEKIREGATMPLPYDYASATHPAWQFWRKIGKTGISTVATYKKMDPDGKVMRRLGQNTKLLSDIDILKINTVYGLKCKEKKRHVRDDDED